jgi:hypothetical protein
VFHIRNYLAVWITFHVAGEGIYAEISRVNLIVVCPATFYPYITCKNQIELYHVFMEKKRVVMQNYQYVIKCH